VTNGQCVFGFSITQLPNTHLPNPAGPWANPKRTWPACRPDARASVFASPLHEKKETPGEAPGVGAWLQPNVPVRSRAHACYGSVRVKAKLQSGHDNQSDTLELMSPNKKFSVRHGIAPEPKPSVEKLLTDSVISY
jgi:hypothetical protein